MTALARTAEPAIADDYLEGVEEIAAFLGGHWTPQRVYAARRLKTLPIRSLAGVGLYAFKSEISAALKAPGTMP